MPRLRRLTRADYLPLDGMGLSVRRIADHAPSSSPHTHEFEELVIITGGRSRHWVEGHLYDLTAGDIFVILGNTQHCYPETQGLDLINILFDSGRVRLPTSDLGTMPGYQALFRIEPRVRRQSNFQNRLRLDPAQLDTLLGLVDELERELWIRAPGYQFASTAAWMRIIMSVARAYSEKPHDSRRGVLGVSHALSHMEQHLAEPLTIEHLAKVARVSPATLFRQFREILGRSPIDHLLHLRVERARRLLRTTTMRIGEISAAVGFEDSNYFARQFRAITGRSPREYRRESA